MLYINKLRKVGKINLVIVGRDPYPKYATGIPFSKPSWNLLKKNSAGHFVFRSLLGENYYNKAKTPDKLTYFLLNKGIALLNASYQLLDGSPKKHRDIRRIRKALALINSDILQKARQVVLCGAAYKMLNWAGCYKDNKYHAAPHPSLQAYNASKKNRKKWCQFWGVGRLSRYLN